MQPSLVMSVPPIGAENIRLRKVVRPTVMGLQRFGYFLSIVTPPKESFIVWGKERREPFSAVLRPKQRDMVISQRICIVRSGILGSSPGRCRSIAHGDARNRLGCSAFPFLPLSYTRFSFSSSIIFMFFRTHIPQSAKGTAAPSNRTAQHRHSSPDDRVGIADSEKPHWHPGRSEAVAAPSNACGHRFGTFPNYP